MRIEPAQAALGALITGVDLRGPLPDGEFDAIAQAFARYSVVAIRGQELTEAQHVAFSRRFGELEHMKVYREFVSPRHPEIFVVSNIVEDGKPIGLQEAGRLWHTDGSFRPQPPMGSLLYAIEIPVAGGKSLGDTLFASACAAHDALDEGMKLRLQGLRAVHRLADGIGKDDAAKGVLRRTLTEEQKRAVQEVDHPVVRVHPVTGRRCIYVNEQFTDRILGLPAARSDSLLRELCAHIVQPRFVYRHEWAPGDLVIWDNCAAQHQAIGDYALPLRRLMHRVTVQGDVPAG